MSRRHDVQDATGRIEYYAGRGTIQAWARGTPPTSGPPSNGDAGFAPGCIYHDLTNGHLYCNIGTFASAIWQQLDRAGLSRSVINTADTTVGAATLTAAEIVGGLITRSGSVAAYSDTTATAALIIAALPTGTPVLASWYLEIKNTVPYTETLVGGVGVTLSGNTVIPGNTVGRFLVTYATATTVTIVGVQATDVAELPSSQFATGTTTTTFAAGQLTGAEDVVYTNTQATPGSIATRTAVQMFADIPNAQVGGTYRLRVINGQGTGTLTITAGVGVTLTGTATVFPNTWRDYEATINSATTFTLQDIGSGAMDLTLVGVASGYKVARGVSSITGSGTVATGLATVVAVVAMMQADASLTNGFGCTGTIGDQAGSPAAGSVILKVWKSTGAGDATPIASAAAVSVNWVAVGT